jgi:Arc/MetJ family transcription regulator
VITVIRYPWLVHNRLHMRTTLNVDDALIREASRLTGLQAKTDVIHEGLRALITRESARRLAALGGKLPAAKAPRRRPRRPR